MTSVLFSVEMSVLFLVETPMLKKVVQKQYKSSTKVEMSVLFLVETPMLKKVVQK